MRIIHLSDLHFGTEMPELVESLSRHIRETPAHLIVVSGDLTQIASHEEFHRARDFIRSFDTPLFCVPGNHDIPCYNLIERMTAPYRRYRRYISADIAPVLKTPDFCMAGINTARRILPHWNWAHGAVSSRQLQHVRNSFEASGAPLRLCVMHHPVHEVANQDFRTIVFGGTHALNALGEMKVDLVMTGHVHHATATVVEHGNHRTMFLGASTALSRRLRQSANGYNAVTIENGRMAIEMFSYRDRNFVLQDTIRHEASGH